MEARIDHATANRLLAMLDTEVRQRLLAASELIELEPPRILGVAGEALPNAYFPSTAMLGILTPVQNGRRVGLGLVGFEGCIGAASALGSNASSFDVQALGSGLAWRIKVQDLGAITRSAGDALPILLSRYLQVRRIQLAQQAVCLHYHSLEQRLCSWLLAAQDRMRSPDVLVTHGILSVQLGARRSGVTVAAGALQARGLSRYNRGHILVLDRVGLAASACACHRLDRATYERILRSA